MSKTYYVIELTPRWLAILLVATAGLMVLAFVGGYGAAWSNLGGSVGTGVWPVAGAEDEIAEVEIGDPQTSEIVASVATPVPPKPTVTPNRELVKPTPRPASTATPQPTPSPQPTAVPAAPKPTVTPKVAVFAVQVLASSRIQAIEKARRQLVDLGFPNSGHKIVETLVAGGGILLKLRIGPFPDHASAERVMRRMQAGGFPDAWVVQP